MISRNARQLQKHEKVLLQLNVTQNVPRYLVGDTHAIGADIGPILNNAIKFTGVDQLQLKVEAEIEENMGMVFLFC